jgi:hypothetical protein
LIITLTMFYYIKLKLTGNWVVSPCSLNFLILCKFISYSFGDRLV